MVPNAFYKFSLIFTHKSTLFTYLRNLHFTIKNFVEKKAYGHRFPVVRLECEMFGYEIVAGVGKIKGRRKRKLSEAAATVEAEVRSFAEVETSLIRNIGGNNGLNTEVTIKRLERNVE